MLTGIPKNNHAIIDQVCQGILNLCKLGYSSTLPIIVKTFYIVKQNLLLLRTTPYVSKASPQTYRVIFLYKFMSITHSLYDCNWTIHDNIIMWWEKSLCNLVGEYKWINLDPAVCILSSYTSHQGSNNNLMHIMGSNVVCLVNSRQLSSHTYLFMDMYTHSERF